MIVVKNCFLNGGDPLVQEITGRLFHLDVYNDLRLVGIVGYHEHSRFTPGCLQMFLLRRYLALGRLARLEPRLVQPRLKATGKHLHRTDIEPALALVFDNDGTALLVLVVK